MDAGSVTESPKQRPSWKLRPEIAALTQGLVVSGFGGLPTGRALFLEFGAGLKGGKWLGALDKVAPVTPAVPPAKEDGDSQSQATAIAFTWTGLKRMDLPETALASFSRPFREGMFQEDRLRRLGDRRQSERRVGEWLDTVAEGGPTWSANTPLREPVSETVGAFDVKEVDKEEHIETPVTVHAVLLLYTKDEPAAGRPTTTASFAAAGSTGRRSPTIGATTARTGGCCSSASTPTSRGSSSSLSRPGSSTPISRCSSTKWTR